MNFKEYFKSEQIINEYKVNINNAVKWFRLTNKQLENISELIGIELNKKFGWFIFKIEDQEYISGYITVNNHFTFFNLTQAIKDHQVSFDDLNLLDGKKIFEFINTLCSILKFLADNNANQFIFVHDNAKRRKLYFDFLTKSSASFLPEFKTIQFDDKIILYKPRKVNLEEQYDFKSRINQQNNETVLFKFKNFVWYDFPVK